MYLWTKSQAKRTSGSFSPLVCYLTLYSSSLSLLEYFLQMVFNQKIKTERESEPKTGILDCDMAVFTDLDFTLAEITNKNLLSEET